MQTPTRPAVEGLVIDDLDKGIFRVNRRAFTDPDVLAAEKKLIFDQCWLYVGHESELPEPGSYIKRKVGGRPIIFVRDDQGTIRVLFDACTHRGNTLGNAAMNGKATKFVCFYHGWTFSTRGELINVPDQMSYGECFDRKQLGLGTPPRVDNYRGLFFLSMKADIVDLKTYLGGATAYIDDMIDLTDSEMAIAPGQQSYSMKANWKLLVENSADAYHAPFTHQRFFTQFIQDIGADLQAWAKMAQQTTDNRVIGFPHGHGIMDVPAGPLPMNASDPGEVAKLRATLTAKYGAERTACMMDRSRNLIIFPNLILISAWRTIRTFWPVAPDYMEIDAWAIIGKNDSPALREMRYNNFICFLGPAGFGTPDDVEALARCQKGFAATEMAWTDLSKGMHRPGGSLANDEYHMRNVWRTWASMLDPGFKPSSEKSNAMANDPKVRAE